MLFIFIEVSMNVNNIKCKKINTHAYLKKKSIIFNVIVILFI